LPSYPTPITAIACPSIGNGVEIALKITIGGDKSPKKIERAGVQSRKLVAARPLTDDGLMGGLSLGGEMAPIFVVLLLLHIKTHILLQIWPDLLTFAPPRATLIKNRFSTTSIWVSQRSG
jgi:hypothetical protein